MTANLKARAWGAGAALLAIATVAPAAASQAAGAQMRTAQVPGQGQGQGRAGAEQRLAQVLREQLQLTDAQATRLQETNRKFNPRRTALVNEERQVRQAMRDALCSDDQSQGAEVGRWIDQMLDLEKRRIDLRIEEQRELSSYLSPYQRAKYLGAVEVVQRRFEGEGRGGPPGGPRGGMGRGGPPPERRGPPPEGRGGPPPLDACGNPLPARGGRQ